MMIILLRYITSGYYDFIYAFSIPMSYSPQTLSVALSSSIEVNKSSSSIFYPCTHCSSHHYSCSPSSSVTVHSKSGSKCNYIIVCPKASWTGLICHTH